MSAERESEFHGFAHALGSDGLTWSLVRRLSPWSSQWDGDLEGQMRMGGFWVCVCAVVAAIVTVNLSVSDGTVPVHVRHGIEAAWQSQMSDADNARFEASTHAGFSWSRTAAGIEIMARVSRDACVAIATDLPAHTDSISVVSKVGASTRITQWTPASAMRGARDAEDACDGSDATIRLRIAKPHLQGRTE